MCPDALDVGAHELDVERQEVGRMYARLDDLRDRVDRQLREVRRTAPSGSPQNRSERDAFAQEYERRLAQLWSVEERLAFGRLDLRDAERRYVGRIGLSDEQQHQLLVDWRADAAQDFYRATGAEPGDVVRRRHIAMRGRDVLGVEDEVFDLDAVQSSGAEETLVLSGEGALMAALAEHRTGHMRDIVSTIQREQDRIIRSPLEGVLVVQGGPGTGKTAVALHRAAYLLYQHRERLARSGVLIVGPNPLFLRYIEQVLPSLGETAAVLLTPDELVPGVQVNGEDPPDVAVLKGDARMADVLAAAVRDLQRVPPRPVALNVDGTTLRLSPQVVRRAVDRARRSGRPHNAAREQFVRQVLDHLAGQLATAMRVSLDADYRDDLLADLRDARDVRREVNLCWMPTSPQRLLRRLFSDTARLASAASAVLSDAEQRALLRDADAPWTVADVALLDAAAVLLGVDDSANRAADALDAVESAERVRYAQGVLAGGTGGGLVDAATLAERFAEHDPDLTVAERAAADPSWTFGHVVVDEAQELSAMQWRAVLRRCPSRSLTVVGDPAQTASAAGVGHWGDVLDRVAPGRWRLEELTVNYRTPAEVMAVADRVAAAGGAPVRPQVAARHGQHPVVAQVPQLTVAALAHVVVAELEAAGAGRVAVVLPRHGHDEVRAGLFKHVMGRPAPTSRERLDEPLVILSVGDVKGLEFDSVVVVEPADVVEQSARGVGDLYVALTRPTQRLTVVHAHALPDGFQN